MADAAAEPSHEAAAVSTAPDVDAAAAERVGCPACGAPNSPHRILCGRCAADLATGEVAEPQTPTTPPPAAEPTVDIDEQDGRTRRARLLTSAVVAVIVLALVAAVLAATGVLPSGDGDDTSSVARFSAAAYPGPVEDLAIDRVTTSSTLPPASDVLSYEPALMLDDELATAWNNDGAVNVDGVGEVIRVEFDAPVWLSRIVVGNGAQLDDARFLANARIERAQITLDGGVGFVLALDDSQGLQQRSLPEPELTTGVRIEVVETYPGDTHDDLAISELGFEGHPADETDRRIAEARADE